MSSLNDAGTDSKFRNLVTKIAGPQFIFGFSKFEVHLRKQGGL